jgi:hypothetical protein
MVASYSQESTIEQAFKDTFGGERPCSMCKIITAVSETEPETPRTVRDSSKLTLMLGLAKSIKVHVPQADTAFELCSQQRPRSALNTVPTPPPRLV